MKSIINCFVFVFNSKQRKQKRQDELEWSEERIKIIEIEIADMEKILPGAPKSLQDDLERNYSLLGYYKEREKDLKKRLN